MPDNVYLEVGKGVRSNTDNWYKVIQPLGAGGNAATFLVLCTSGMNKGQLFAIKIFRRLSIPNRRKRFLDEIEFLKGCDHPAIVPVFDDGLYYDTPFVVVEYLPETLRRALPKSFTIVQKVGYSLQLLSAINYLASRNPPVIHRDIKPENIFVKGNLCVLGDLGLLKVLNDDENIEDDRNMMNESYGPRMPFFYRTPDLVDYALTGKPLTSKTDVFQLGLVLAELFSGINPEQRPEDILAPVVLEPLRNIPGTSGAGIATLIYRMLVFEPENRPSARDLLDPFQAIMEDIVQKAIDLNGKAY